MQYTTRIKFLRYALIVIGLISLFGVYPMTIFWPSGFVWHHGGPAAYLQMIEGIYATLGVFLLMAAKSPEEHLSLIWFAVWSSVVHAGIMAVQAIFYSGERAHLHGDVLILLIAAVVLGLLTPHRKSVAAFRAKDNRPPNSP